MAKRALVFVFLCVMFNVSFCWIDPNEYILPIVTVKPAAVDSADGDQQANVVEYSCSGYYLPEVEGMRWMHAIGNREIILNESTTTEVSIRKEFTRIDNGTALYCYAWFYDRKTKLSFDVVSDLITLIDSNQNFNDTANDTTNAATTSIFPRVSTSPTPSGAPYSAGDLIEFTCSVENLSVDSLNWYQKKGNLETVVAYTDAGGDLTLRMNATPADNDTVVYCWTWFQDEENYSGRVISDFINIYVN